MTASRVLLPVPLDDLLTTPTPAPAFAVEGLVPRGVVTLLGGHGGAGKSLLALTIAAHIAGGEHHWAARRIDDGPALFVSLEDPGAIVRFRLRKILECFGLDADKVARRLTVVDGTEGNGMLSGEVNDAGIRHLALSSAYAELEELAPRHRLIVIDNASDAFDANENDRRMVRAFIRSLSKIARDNDAGVLLLAHIDKHAARNGSAGNTFSGSTAWHNSARSRLALTKSEIGTVELIHEKSNFGPLVDPMPFQWSEGGVLVPVQRSAGAGAPDDADAVLAAMQAAHAAGVDVGAGRTGNGNAHATLSTFAELPDRLKDGRGKRAFWAAIGKLQSSGRITTNVITTSQRKPKKVLICANSDAPVPSAPIPPHPLAQYMRALGAPSCASSAPIELAQTGAAETCPRCAGEGCRHCRRAA